MQLSKNLDTNSSIRIVYILAFETSCDDTSVAIMRDDSCIALSTRTQLEHDSTGWVVPEVAARSHANAIFPCIDDVLTQADIELTEIDFFACTEKPWLLPSLLTGMTVAKTLATSLNKPILWIDHIESHMFANLLERNLTDIVFPSVVLTVSGWHTEIYLWKHLFEFQILWQSRDDAVGEAYDKVAKMLWLWFPGGAKIAALASGFRSEESDEIKEQYRYLFPRSFLPNTLDFSFSGLKSAVKRYIDFHKDTLSHGSIAFAFEEAVVDVLVKKMLDAASEHWVHQTLLAGGVSANSYLRERISTECDKYEISFLAPIKNIYSQDNAAMVGIRAYYQITQRP